MRLWAIKDRKTGKFIKHRTEDRIMFFGIPKNAERHINSSLGGSKYLDIVEISEYDTKTGKRHKRSYHAKAKQKTD
jgi:hypothetical protein